MEYNFTSGNISHFNPSEFYNDTTYNVFGLITTGVKCVIALWIIIFNSIFIAALRSAEHPRERCLYWVLINLAVADLLVGLVVIPPSVNLALTGYWMLGEIICKIWILSDVLLCCLSLFALLAINIDRLVFVVKPLTYTMVMRKGICICLIICSWLLAIAIMLPLVFTDQIRTADGNCYVSLAPIYAVASAGVSYFLPGFLVISTNICIAIVVARKTRNKRKSSIKLEKNPNEPPTLVARSPSMMATMVEAREKASRDTNIRLKKVLVMMCIVNCVYLIMWLPFFLLNLLIVGELYKDIPVFALELSLWLGYANSGLNPLLWMIYPDIRKAVKDTICCCCRRKRSQTTPDDTVHFTKNTMYTNSM